MKDPAIDSPDHDHQKADVQPSTPSQTCIQPGIHRKPLPEPGSRASITPKPPAKARDAGSRNRDRQQRASPNTRPNHLNEVYYDEKAIEAGYTECNVSHYRQSYHDRHGEHGKNKTSLSTSSPAVTAVERTSTTTSLDEKHGKDKDFEAGTQGESYHFSPKREIPNSYSKEIGIGLEHNQSQLNGPLPPLPIHSSASKSRRQRHHKPRGTQRYTTFIPGPPSFIRDTALYQRHYLPHSQRTKYLILLCPLLLLVLILVIGLAVGLTHASRSRFSNLPLPTNHGGPYTGDLTYYDPALGACGITSTSQDFIVAVSHLVFDAVSTGSNPNANPLCGKKIRASRGGKSADLVVVDRCTGCKATDLDVTSTVFAGLADMDLGRVDVTWAWLDDVPNAAT